MLKRYIVEGEIPEVGGISEAELCNAAAKSNGALPELAPKVQSAESFVGAVRMFCVYLAVTEDLPRRHAEISGFPANRIAEVPRVIDPTTAKT